VTSGINPFFHFRYLRHATPGLRQLVRALSREARPVRPGFALVALLATALSGFMI
jgi:hypothetical protein